MPTFLCVTCLGDKDNKQYIERWFVEKYDIHFVEGYTKSDDVEHGKGHERRIARHKTPYTKRTTRLLWMVGEALCSSFSSSDGRCIRSSIALFTRTTTLPPHGSKLTPFVPSVSGICHLAVRLSLVLQATSSPCSIPVEVPRRLSQPRMIVPTRAPRHPIFALVPLPKRRSVQESKPKSMFDHGMERAIYLRHRIPVSPKTEASAIARGEPLKQK